MTATEGELATKGDQGCSRSREHESRPAERVQALLGEDGCTNSENYGHRADHQRGVRHGGEREAFKLQKELKRNAEEGTEEQQTPLGCVEAGAVRDEQWEEA